MSNSSIRPIDRTQSGVTTPGQSGPGSEGNEGVFYISQSWSLTFKFFVSYNQNIRDAVMQSVYSTASANWVKRYNKKEKVCEKENKRKGVNVCERDKENVKERKKNKCV